MGLYDAYLIIIIISIIVSVLSWRWFVVTTDDVVSVQTGLWTTCTTSYDFEQCTSTPSLTRTKNELIGRIIFVSGAAMTLFFMLLFLYDQNIGKGTRALMLCISALLSIAGIVLLYGTKLGLVGENVTLGWGIWLSAAWSIAVLLMSIFEAYRFWVKNYKKEGVASDTSKDTVDNTPTTNTSTADTSTADTTIPGDTLYDTQDLSFDEQRAGGTVKPTNVGRPTAVPVPGREQDRREHYEDPFAKYGGIGNIDFGNFDMGDQYTDNGLQKRAPKQMMPRQLGEEERGGNGLDRTPPLVAQQPGTAAAGRKNERDRDDDDVDNADQWYHERT